MAATDPPKEKVEEEQKTAEAIEKRKQLEKEQNDKLEKDLAAYKEKNADLPLVTYSQPKVTLPDKANEIKITAKEKPEEEISEGAECQVDGVKVMCRKAKVRCVNCDQIYCTYHARPNTGGLVGGHTCKGTVACSSTFHFYCKGENKICSGCGLSYCNYHFEGGTNLIGSGGHLCTGGCSTSLIFTPNCEGDIKKCPHCNMNYCNYHYPTADKVTTLRAGHVCGQVTGGAMLFGDSFGDFFSLAGQVVITFASGGTCPIAAITLLFRSMKIAVLTMIDKYGLQDMKPFVMKVVDWVSAQTGLKEGQLTDTDRAGRSIMFEETLVSEDKVKAFCAATQAAGVAIGFINKLHEKTIPDWLKIAVDTAHDIGKSVEIYQKLVVNAIKASFMISEILGLIYHLEAAWAGNLGEIITAVKSAANVIDDFNILFGFTTQKEVDEKNNAAGKKSIDLHRHLEAKHSVAHAKRSINPMNDTDRRIIRYARKNNYGKGDLFMESLMAFDSQIELLKNQKKEVAQAHDDEIRRLTARIRELEMPQRKLRSTGPRCLPAKPRGRNTQARANRRSYNVVSVRRDSESGEGGGDTTYWA